MTRSSPGSEVYDLVRELHINLSPSSQEATLQSIGRARARYQDLMCAIPAFRMHIIELWATKYYLSKHTRMSAVTSKLAKDFNTSRRGLNQKIRKRVDHHLGKVRDLMKTPTPWSEEYTLTAIHHFREAGIASWIVTGKPPP